MTKALFGASTPILAACVLAIALSSPSARAQSNQTATDAGDLGDLSLVDLMQIDEKVTTATRSVALALEEAPSTITLITRAEIDRNGYRTIGEALNTVPGLFVVDDLVTSNLAVRGIHGGPDSWSRTVKFMIDGKPVQYQSTGGALLGPEFVPMDVVESIEVIRGPGSAMYGANAFLGVVNVITREPDEDGWSALASAEGGFVRTNPGAGAGGYVSYRGGGERPFWVSLSASGARVDRSGLTAPESSPNADDFAGIESEDDINRPVSALGRAGWDLQEYGAIELESIYQRLDSGAVVSELGAFEPDTRFAKSNFINRVDYTIPVLKSWVLGPDWKQTASVHTWFGTTHGQTLDAEVLAAPSGSFHRRRFSTTVEGGAEFSYAMGRNSALVGVDYQQLDDDGETIFDIDETTGERSRRNDPDPFSTTNLGVLGQVMVYPIRPLALTGSVRLDENTKWGTNATYRAAGVYKVFEQLYLKVLAGTSFVPPAPSQLGAVPLVLNGGVVGNPDLESQQARTVEGAALVRPIDSLKVDVTVFRTDIERRVENQVTGELFTAQNMTDSKSVGVEVAAAWDYEPVSLKGDIAVQRTELDEPEVVNFQWTTAYGEDVPGGNSPPNFPNVLGHLSAGLTLPEFHAGGAVTATYVGERKASVANIRENGEAYVLDPYMVLGLHVRTLDVHLIPDRLTEVSAHVDNVLNAQYEHGGARGVDIPAMGRSVFVKMKQEF
jgi:iron complex outermembrane receptor protein